MRIAIQGFGPVDEMAGIQQGGDFRPAELILPVRIIDHWQPAAPRITGFAQIGGDGGQVIKSDIGADINGIREQQVAQKRHLHRLALGIIGDQLAHIAGADAVIDRVMEPVVRCSQYLADMGFTQTGHAEKQHAFMRGI